MPAESAAKRNAQLLAELDARFRAPLMAFFLRRVGNRTDAEDLTQETFERLLRAENFDAAGHVTGYVFRVAVNLLRDRHRSAVYRRHVPFSAFEPELLERISAELLEDREPERVLLGREGLIEVLRCLDELGERTKTVFILYRLEGMKQREIAELLGMGLSTVEKHCMLAMTLLIARFGTRRP
jgi:RNA polymerase sigma-70 factor (ECF subfamily)